MPETPGFETYHVFPQEGLICNFNIIIPSVKGEIGVEISKEPARYVLKLSSPGGTKAAVSIPKKFGGLNTIKVNGIIVWQKASFTGGIEGIYWKGEDSRYYKFDVDPGIWGFIAA